MVSSHIYHWDIVNLLLIFTTFTEYYETTSTTQTKMKIFEHYSPCSFLKMILITVERLKSPWASVLKSIKERRWKQVKPSLHWSADLFTDAFIGSIIMTNENAWIERHCFSIGSQSFRHVVFIINDSYAGIYHHWSRKEDWLLIPYC